MKAAVLEKVKSLVVKDIPRPELEPDEVLIKVAARGICGTDIKLYEGKYTANVPVVLGHEYAGEVVSAGKNVKNIKEGEKESFIPFDVLSKELTIMGSWVNPYTFSRALDILASKKVDVKPLISMRLPLDNIMDGFKAMTEKPKGFMKALVQL